MASIAIQSLRSLLRSRAFSVTTIGSVAATVGLACSVFAVAQPDLFPSVPYPDASRLVQLWPTANPASDQPNDYLLPDRMTGWIGLELRFLETVSGRGMGAPLTLELDEGARRVETEPIAGDWFTTLGVSAERGRILQAVDLEADALPAAVVSHAFWRDLLSEDRAFPGATISLSGTVFTRDRSHARVVRAASEGLREHTRLAGEAPPGGVCWVRASAPGRHPRRREA
jgi:hypothetical protein